MSALQPTERSAGATMKVGSGSEPRRSGASARRSGIVNQGAAEQQHAKERRLEKESCQPLIGQSWADDVACGIGQAAPIGAELEGHNDPGHHPHAESDREDPYPEIRDLEADAASGGQMQPFEQRDVGCGTDGEGRQQDVPADIPRRTGFVKAGADQASLELALPVSANIP
jgi:hypothetical protein